LLGLLGGLKLTDLFLHRYAQRLELDDRLFFLD